MRIRPLIAACMTLAAIAVAAPASASADPLLGFIDNFGIGDMERSVALTQQHFGVKTNRLFVRWDWMEKKPGQYDFVMSDRSYATLKAAGQRPTYVIVGTPDWARPGECLKPTSCPHTTAHDGAWQQFLRTFASRYPDAVAIELGNEPNLNGSWDHPNPEAYAQYLRSGYEAIKQVAPGIQVLIGGITPGAVSGNGIEATEFLRRLYLQGAKDFSDGIGYHVYVAGQVNEVAPDIKNILVQANRVRKDFGDDGKFWITETGFPSTGKSEYSPAVFDEFTQGQRYSISYRVFKSFDEVAAVYYFRVVDFPEGNHLEQSMGIFRADGSSKPAVEALKKAIAAKAEWPSYTMKVKGPKTAVGGSSFAVTATGYKGRGKVKYEWLLKRPAGHWSLPVATTTKPVAKLKYGKPGKYTVGVRLVTSNDAFTSPKGHTVTVKPKPKAAKKSKKKSKNKKRKKSKRKK